MSVSTEDNNWNHLLPEFRAKLRAVLREVEEATGEPWEMVEGYRSQARQTWLYAQGRTRPGAVITWKKTPSWHGTGVAADVRPARVRREGYGHIPHSHWERLRAIYTRHGLANPAWKKGDFQHIQWTSSALAAKGRKWVAAGFPQPPEEGDMAEDLKQISVTVNDKPTEIRAVLIDGVSYASLADVSKELGWPGPTWHPPRRVNLRTREES